MPAAWFLGRAQWRRRWVGLLLVGLLAGLVGGVVLSSVGGIRRSSSAFDRLTADMDLLPYLLRPPTLTGLPTDYGARLAELPEVEAVTSTRQYVGRERVQKNWWSLSTFADDDPTRLLLVDGREPLPDQPSEVVVSVNTARLYGLDVGSDLEIDFYSAPQLRSISQDSWTEPDGPRPVLRVVGIYREPLDATRTGTGTSVRAGQSFDAAYGTNSGVDGFQLRTRPGVTLAQLTAAVDRINATYPGLAEDGVGPRPGRWTDVAERSADQSAGVITIGLLAFAAVAAVAGLVAYGQTLRRWAHPVEAEQAPLAAMGATRSDRRRAIAIALAPHVVVAIPVAAAIAYLTSPLFPMGAVSDIEPTPGLRADPLLLVVGAIAVAVATAAVSALVASAVVRGRTPRRRVQGAVPVLGSLEAVGAPVPATVGARFVLRPGGARMALPVNTAIVAAVLAVAGVTAASAFTTSLDRLVSTPSRYGNDWDLSIELLSSPNGEPELQKLIDDPRIAAIDIPRTLYPSYEIGGVPTQLTLLRTVKGTQQLEMLRGRPPTGPQEIVLGPKLLADIGLEIGETVAVGGPVGEPVEFTVVGSALSSLYESAAYHSEAFVSADVDTSILPPDLDEVSFDLTQVAFAPGTDDALLSAELDQRYPFAVMNESFPRPPSEITNVSQLTALPRLLAGFLAFLGFAALVHALVVTVRSRRRDLGILRSLGFTRAQAAATIVSMTSTIVLVGVVVGVPLGAVLGASGWRLVAQRVYVSTDALVPWAIAALAAVIALAVANLVALLPARAAANQAPIDSLRAE